jgi:glutathione S-transferase
VPVLLVDGEPIFESAVIAEYLDETTPGSLHPEGALDRARNRAWIEFASTTLAAISAFYSAADPQAFRGRINLLRSRFARLEDELGTGPWFNGASFSLVDAAWAPVFRYFDVIETYEDFGFFHATPKVRSWRERLRERPSVRRAVVADYPERLHRFFLDRNSELTRRILARHAA